MRAALILLLAGAALAREPFAPTDLWLWATASDPQVSSDGRWVVYVEARNDRDKDDSFANLRLVSADGRVRKPFTDGVWTDRNPRWSPDGSRIAYLSRRNGTVFIRVRRTDAAPNTEIVIPAAGAIALAWSPDGRQLAFTAPVQSKPQAPAWAPAALLPFLDTGLPRQTVEVFVVPAETGAPRQLTHGSFVRRGPPAWTPDGEWILTSAEPAPDPAHPLEGAEIYATHVPDGESRPLTQHPGPDQDPLPSPDGAKIAWLASEIRPPAYAIRKLWVMAADGKRSRVLTGSLDRDVMFPQWSSDSRTVYFLAEDRGSTHVYAARNDGTVRQVTDRAERLHWFSLADNGRAVTVRSTGTEGGDVVSFAVDLPGGVTTLAAPNEQLLATRDIAPREEIHFESGGKDVRAWLVKPLRIQEGKLYPLLVETPDALAAAAAPHRMCGTGFPLRAQMFAARGFIVLCVNPRGTPGYGEDFGNLLRSRFPGDDFDDLMRGVEAALARAPVDPKRIAIAGGLLAAWAIGHTGRFAAAILHPTVADWTSAIALAPDGYRRAAAWMGALPWDDPDQYLKHSPLFSAQNFKTPALLIGAPGDVQAGELWFALQARGTGSAWAGLPEEGKPSTAILQLETEIAWLDHRLNAPADR